MQGQNGPRAAGVVFNRFSDIVIDSNLVVRQTDPKLAFPTYLQGIDAFDEAQANLTVTNNVIVTSACWGISYASVHGGKILDNTVVDDGTNVGARKTPHRTGHVPPRRLSVRNKTQQGPSSNDVIIRNNIGGNLGIYDPDPNMTMDHNVCVTIAGKCPILRYMWAAS